jgi:hypothetical protein
MRRTEYSADTEGKITRDYDTKTKKLHGLSPHANYTDRLSDRRLSA